MSAGVARTISLPCPTCSRHLEFGHFIRFQVVLLAARRGANTFVCSLDFESRCVQTSRSPTRLQYRRMFHYAARNAPRQECRGSRHERGLTYGQSLERRKPSEARCRARTHLDVDVEAARVDACATSEQPVEVIAVGGH